MDAAAKLMLLQDFAPVLVVIVALGIGGWVLTTWMRVRHGYPLDGAWGQAVYPAASNETSERVKLLSQENAQLRAELGSIKDRLATVERIVTDSGHMLDREIAALRDRAN